MQKLFAIIVLLPLILVTAPAFADKKEKTVVKVGLLLSEPFVIDLGSSHYSGFAFNLWEMVAARYDLKSEYLLYPSITQLLEDAQSGKIDIAVTNIAVSYERVKNLQFSFPWYDSGLRILVKHHAHRFTVWDFLQQRGQIAALIWIALLVIVLAVAQALLRRRKDADFPICWLEGVSLSLHEVVRSAKAGVPQKNVLGWAGNVILTLWMIFGFCLLAYVTSTLTTAMTATGAQLHDGDIHGLHDLKGRKVGVIVNTEGEKYMQETGIGLVSFTTLKEAVAALLKGDIDAVVKNATELEYFVYSHPVMNFEIVGNMFNPHKYAFAASKTHVHLMNSVSEELIRILGDGTMEKLKDKYFGRVRF